jgi:hypothetical protein
MSREAPMRRMKALKVVGLSSWLLAWLPATAGAM